MNHYPNCVPKNFNRMDDSNDTKKGKVLSYDANSLDIGVWGVSVVLGGALYGWNAALVTGFGMYSLAQGMIVWYLLEKKIAKRIYE